MIYLLAILIECALLCVGLLHSSTAQDVVWLAGAHAFTFACYAMAVYSKKLTTTPVWFIVVAAIVFKVTLLLQPITASDDVYRYLWDGKVSAHGINPYVHAPNDSNLAWLHSSTLPALVNVPFVKSVYPPLAQVVFVTSYTLFGERIIGVKIILFLFDCATLAVLLALLRKQKIPAPALLLWAWNPLVHIVTELDAHIEIVGVFFFALCLLALLSTKITSSALWLALAALVKPQPLALLAPLALFITKTQSLRKALLLCVACVGLFVLGYSFYWETTWSFSEAFLLMSKRWYYNNPPFDILHSVVSNEQAHTILSMLLALWIVTTSIRATTLVNHVFRLLLGILLLSPMIQPWYLLWLLFLLPLRWSPAVFVHSATIILCYITVFQWQQHHVWKQSWWELLLEYIPVYILLLAALGKPAVLHKLIPPVLQHDASSC